jgi:hypothetical protein
LQEWVSGLLNPAVAKRFYQRFVVAFPYGAFWSNFTARQKDTEITAEIKATVLVLNDSNPRARAGSFVCKQAFL